MGIELHLLGDEELEAQAREDGARLSALLRAALATEAEVASRGRLWAAAGEPLLPADLRREAIELFDRVLDLVVSLEAIERAHRGFWRLDPLRDGPRHARHFAFCSAAYLGRLSVGLSLVERTLGREHFERLLDEGSEEAGLWPGAFSRLKWGLVHVEHVPRVAATRAYHRLLERTHLRGLEASGPVAEIVASLEPSYERAKARLSSEGPSLLAGNALEILRGAATSAAMPVQSAVAEWLGDTRVRRRDGRGLISPSQVGEMARLSRPGDVVLERRNWFLSNVGLPGFWPHTALWLGSPAELSAYFDGDAEVRQAFGGAFSDRLRQAFPAAFRQYEQPDEHGHPRRLIEAVAEGVLTASAEHSLSADYAAGLRPRRPKLEAARAIERAFGYWGRPYDFDFDFHTDASLVCSELVYKAWEPREGVTGLSLDLVRVLGRPTLPPNEIVAQHDREHGSTRKQLDFVFFFDGIEGRGEAVAAGDEELRASWRRPKWDIAQR